MQEIIEENESWTSQFGLDTPELLQCSDHAFLIIVPWVQCHAWQHGPRAHVVTVTMTHVLLSLMSVYLDLT